MSVPAVLFDEPEPRARARHRLLGVVGALVIAGLLALVVRGLADPDNNQLTAEKWGPFLDGETWTAYLLPGLAATLRAAGAAVVLSGVFGVLLGLGRLAQARVVRGVCGALVEFLRSVPVLVMMLFVYYFCIFVLGVLGDTSTSVGVVGGLTLYNSAVIAELIRSGVFALPRGQREAGLAVGLTPRQTLVTVLLPQAVTAMLPSLISQLVVILKDTALRYIISFTELLRSGTTFSAAYGNLIPTLIVVAVMLIVINDALSLVARLVERRLQQSRRGPRPVGGATPPGGARGAGAGPRRGRRPLPGPSALPARADRDQRAVSVARDSRTTITLI